MKYLGDTIDIHAGAVDLIFPHHENEIAQSEAYTGKKFVKFWFHPEHLMVDGKKMSKSLHNIYTLNDVSEKFKVEPLAFRMLCLMSYYRDKLNFTEASIIDAQNTLNNLRQFVLRIKLISGQSNSYTDNKKLETILAKSKDSFREAIENDLSMPKAMATLFDLIKDFHRVKECSSKDAHALYDYIMDIDRVLGLSLSDVKVEIIASNIHKLAVDREDARKARKYDKADKLRKEIDKAGYTIEDSEDGPVLRKK
jgi:cysteinyl-tRNA synthetase